MSTRPRLTPAIADVRRAVREALGALGAPDAVSAGRIARDVPRLGPHEVARRGPREVPGPTMRTFVNDAPPTTSASLTNHRGDGADSGASAATAASADVLVALSGGPDSLALAAATAFEAPRAGLRAGAVIVDHGLQAGSADVAARAAAQARELGLDPVLVKRVEVGTEGGPEAAAREARYAALAGAASETGTAAVLLGHTLDDQAETVLLGLARGSGGASLSGMAPVSAAPVSPVSPAPLFPFVTNVPDRADTIPTNRNNRGSDGGISGRDGSGRDGSGPGSSGVAATAQFLYMRPLLGIRRAQTLQFCADSGLESWHDPQNADPKFARVRVRETVLPMLEAELGPGVAEALARTAELSREDSEALDHFAEEQAEELADHAEAGLSLSVAGLASNPAALRQRIIRLAVASEFGVSLSRAHTLEVARLVTEWRGQGPLHLPGIRVVRQGGLIVFSAALS